MSAAGRFDATPVSEYSDLSPRERAIKREGFRAGVLAERASRVSTHRRMSFSEYLAACAAVEGPLGTPDLTVIEI